MHPVASDFTGNFSMNISCKHHNQTNETYEYVMTLDTEIDLVSTLTVNEAIRLVIVINKLNVAVKGVIDTAVGAISYWRINLALVGALLLIKPYINIFLSNGFDLNWLI